jgi:hypothetical protein
LASARLLPVKLTSAQAQQSIAPLLQQIWQTTDPHARRALANALKALATNLTDAQGLIVAMSSLDWAATEDEAVDWDEEHPVT